MKNDTTMTSEQHWLVTSHHINHASVDSRHVICLSLASVCIKILMITTATVFHRLQNFQTSRGIRCLPLNFHTFAQFCVI